jgi:hypothetical protein
MSEYPFKEAKMILDTLFEEAQPDDYPRAGMRDERSISDDEMIHEFLRLDNLIREAVSEKQWYSSAIAAKAVGEASGQKTVTLQASDGAQVHVEFKAGWECDSTELETARELLGDEKFQHIFKTEYTPKVRNLRSFMSTVFADERDEVARIIIKENCKEVEKRPWVSAKRK